MPQSATPNLIRVPSITLAIAIVGATAVFGGLGATAAWLAGITPTTSGAMGLIAALAGSCAGVLPWLLRHELTAFNAAATQLISASTRMLIGLAAALGLLLVTDADRPWMLGVFLVATLAGLAAELLVLTPTLRAANHLNPNAPSTATPTPETAG
ncbi:MAG: hypothetical protein ACI89L_000414 [Phycisphaerales bacterium]|jgi:hypothetical protein